MANCHRGFPGWSVLGGRARASGLSRKNSKRHLPFHPTRLEASGQERHRSSQRRRVATRLIQKENALTIIRVFRWTGPAPEARPGPHSQGRRYIGNRGVALSVVMSALGHQRTLNRDCDMSASDQQADIESRC